MKSYWCFTYTFNEKKAIHEFCRFYNFEETHNNYLKIYDYMSSFALKYDMCHKKDSDWITRNKIDLITAFRIIESLNFEYPWFKYCKTQVVIAKIDSHLDADKIMDDEAKGDCSNIKDDTSETSLSTLSEKLEEIDNLENEFEKDEEAFEKIQTKVENDMFAKYFTEKNDKEKE